MKKSELKEIIREEIQTFFEDGLDDLKGPTDAEIGKEKGIAAQYSDEMKKQNMRKFMNHMKDIGAMDHGNKLIDTGKYKSEFTKFNTNREKYIKDRKL